MYKICEMYIVKVHLKGPTTYVEMFTFNLGGLIRYVAVLQLPVGNYVRALKIIKGYFLRNRLSLLLFLYKLMHSLEIQIKHVTKHLEYIAHEKLICISYLIVFFGYRRD